jgi:crotonobetainyl-CoA:carnitine CoA-transferase CaiB-like acyl-CoA transferase
LGNAHPTIVPYELFAASDAPFVLAIGNDRQFQISCETVVQMPSLAADPLYRRNSDRVANRVMLRTILQGVFETQPQSHWLGLLHANVLPAAAVASTDDALASDQARSRGLIREFPDAPGGPVRVVGYPVRFERGLPDPTCPPRLGEGGDEAAARWLAGQAK